MFSSSFPAVGGRGRVAKPQVRFSREGQVFYAGFHLIHIRSHCDVGTVVGSLQKYVSSSGSFLSPGGLEDGDSCCEEDICFLNNWDLRAYIPKTRPRGRPKKIKGGHKPYPISLTFTRFWL